MKSLLRLILLLSLVVLGKLAKQPGALPAALNQPSVRSVESVQSFFARQVSFIEPVSNQGRLQGNTQGNASVSVN
ncbi:hypothetical protein [Hymenobacter koreensis]|uniref:hypothetical protein n=1 Tax=Hymenobacter koreensis TaxID=1084523 RepID=UPI0031E8BF64